MVRALRESEELKFAGAATLAFLILFLLTRRPVFVMLAAVLLFVALAFPRVCCRIRTVWMAIAEAASRVIVSILLAAVFFLVVLPMGLFRRHVLGRDSMRLRQWKAGTSTLFHERSKQITPDDLVAPY